MRLKTIITIVSLIALAVAAGGCHRANHRVVNVVGSTSVQPFAEMLAEDFNRGGIDVEVQGGGSTQGVKSIIDGSSDIGTCSRSLSADELAQGLKPIVIAFDGLAIVINPKNPVSDLSKEQIRLIFKGVITDWSAVGGPAGPIRVITREEGSGTREAFTGMIMKDSTGVVARISSRAITQPSNGTVKELVRNDPNAIGYMSLGIVEISPDLKAISVDKVTASVENVKNKSYKLVRPFLFIHKGSPSADAQQFIDYVLGPTGQEKLEHEGLIKAVE